MAANTDEIEAQGDDNQQEGKPAVLLQRCDFGTAEREKQGAIPRLRPTLFYRKCVCLQRGFT